MVPGICRGQSWSMRLQSSSSRPANNTHFFPLSLSQYLCFSLSLSLSLSLSIYLSLSPSVCLSISLSLSLSPSVSIIYPLIKSIIKLISRHRAKVENILLVGEHVWNQFSFFQTDCHTKVKELSLPYYFTGGRIAGFISFPRMISRYEIQSASSRAWNCVIVLISYNDNRYITGVSRVYISKS